MKYCTNCKSFIDDNELEGTGEFFKGIEGGCCPHCHSERLEEADKCEICGAWVAPYEQFCEDCKTEFMNAWSEAVVHVKDFAKTDTVKAERLLLEFLEREVF